MVSIVISNLNTDVRFLESRLQSVRDQTFTDWECIVIDGFSNNGSWEFIQEATEGDSRFRLYQKPKRGIYNAWNEGIKLAKGEFISVAPSDDTMEPEFLTKMVEALRTNPQCDLAHCCLTIIDENNVSVRQNSWDNFLSPKFFGGAIHKTHIRYAPHDGILHAFIKTIYSSITQLLIRRSVFQELGYFIEDAGSIADFEWEMRVSLIKNIIHVPEYLASWRVHKLQATQDTIQTDVATYVQLMTWVEGNVRMLEKKNPEAAGKHSLPELLYVYKNNARHFRLKKLVHQHKLMSPLYKRVVSYFPYLNGLEAAKEYFRKKNMSALIEYI